MTTRFIDCGEQAFGHDLPFAGAKRARIHDEGAMLDLMGSHADGRRASFERMAVWLTPGA